MSAILVNRVYGISKRDVSLNEFLNEIQSWKRFYIIGGKIYNKFWTGLNRQYNNCVVSDEYNLLLTDISGSVVCMPNRHVKYNLYQYDRISTKCDKVSIRYNSAGEYLFIRIN